MTDIFSAIKAGDVEQVRALIATDPASATARDAGGLSPLTQAAYRGRKEIVEILLAASPELDIFEASTVGRADRVRELLETDPTLKDAYSPDGFTALHLAAHFGHADVARGLIECGASVHALTRNPLANQPLHAAAAGDQTETAVLLIAAGADVNARQHQGITPLHLAAGDGNVALASALLSAGADPALRSDDGRDAAAFAKAEEVRAILAR